MLKRYS